MDFEPLVGQKEMNFNVTLGTWDLWGEFVTIFWHFFEQAVDRLFNNEDNC